MTQETSRTPFLSSPLRFALCFLIVLAMAFGASGSLAEESTENTHKLISRAVLFGNPDRTNVQLSHDGQKISYLAAVDGVLNIWVAPVDDLDAAKPVTRDTHRGIRIYFWGYTHHHLIFLQDKGGDENWRAYAIDLGSGKEVDLTPFEGVRAQIQGVSPKHPHTILVGLNDRDPRLHDLYRIDLRTGERTLVLENDGKLGYASDDDYRVRVAVTMGADGAMRMDKHVDDTWQPFQTVGPDDNMTTNTIGFDRDGRHLYLYDSRGRNTRVVKAIDLVDGSEEILEADDKSDIAGVLTHPVEKHIQAVRTNYDRPAWKVLDPSIAQDFAVLETLAGDGGFRIESRTLDDRHWLVTVVSDRGPARFYRYDRKTRQHTFLFSNREALEDIALAPMHPRVIRARDGLELVSYLTLPPWTDPEADGLPHHPLPMVLWVHGGPWARDTWGYNPRHQWLANRGYAVLSVNYRGSSGFGKDFLNAGNMEWSKKMHDDLIDAVEWAVQHEITARDRVAIAGGSYGGYATLVGLTFTPEVFACGVDIVGPSNLITLVQNVPPYWRPFLPALSSRVGDIATLEGRRHLRAISPLTHVDEIVRPLLIGQGANDPRVKQIESDQIVEAMLERDIPVTYVLYPDEGHGFRRPENSMSFYAVTEAFLAQHLGGRVEPIGDDFDGSSIQVPTGVEAIPGLQEALAARGGS